ncbi:hypothetical protein [Neisseria musculi]|uniref:hypothetical protein n=1 Tax=Neisseria musculi TaxID=1815583 RepID=UPI003610DE0C
MQENAPQRFTARQIAEALAAQYPDDYRNKKAAFADEKNLSGKSPRKSVRKKTASSKPAPIL